MPNIVHNNGGRVSDIREPTLHLLIRFRAAKILNGVIETDIGSSLALRQCNLVLKSVAY